MANKVTVTFNGEKAELVKGSKEYANLDFSEKGIFYKGEEVKVDHARVSLFSMIYDGKQMAKNNGAAALVFGASIMGVYTRYYVDLTLGDKTYSIMNSDAVTKVFEYLDEHHIEVEDELKIRDIYKTHTDQYDRWHYINIHFRDWAKTYHLDNPRA